MPITSQGPAGKQGIDGEMGQMGEKVEHEKAECLNLH